MGRKIKQFLERPVDVTAIYRNDARPSEIQPKTAIKCAAQLNKTHRHIGSIATWDDETIGQMLATHKSEEPLASNGDAIAGPDIDPWTQEISMDQLQQCIGLWITDKSDSIKRHFDDHDS